MKKDPSLPWVAEREKVVAKCPDCGHEDLWRSGRDFVFQEARLRCRECGREFWLAAERVSQVRVPVGCLAVTEASR